MRKKINRPKYAVDTRLFGMGCLLTAVNRVEFREVTNKFLLVFEHRISSSHLRFHFVDYLLPYCDALWQTSPFTSS